MRKLALVPSQAGYSAAAPDDSVYVKLDGGLGKIRLDQVGGSATVSVTWVLDDAQYQYFTAFWRVAGNGTSRFLIDLILGEPLLREHVALFVPGTLSLEGTTGHSYRVRAELEVEPAEYDAALDEWILESYEDGGAMSALLARLAVLVNEDLVA